MMKEMVVFFPPRLGKYLGAMCYKLSKELF